MAKIVTRLSDDALLIEQLTEILFESTGGIVCEGGDVGPGNTVQELVDQLDTVCASFMQTLQVTDVLIGDLRGDKFYLEEALARSEKTLEPFVAAIDDGVSYDEDLDHATSDAMEYFLSTGNAVPTDDGAILFDKDTKMSLSDLKPIIKLAVESWLRLKNMP